MSSEADFADMDRAFRGHFGRGLDFAEIDDFGSAEYSWLVLNGMSFGWYQPVTHRKGGPSPDPQYWVYLPDWLAGRRSLKLGVASV